jgi:hypothetical protein
MLFNSSCQLSYFVKGKSDDKQGYFEQETFLVTAWMQRSILALIWLKSVSIALRMYSFKNLT